MTNSSRPNSEHHYRVPQYRPARQQLPARKTALLVLCGLLGFGLFLDVVQAITFAALAPDDAPWPLLGPSLWWTLALPL